MNSLAADIGGPCRYLQAQVAKVAGVVHDEDRALDLKAIMNKVPST